MTGLILLIDADHRRRKTLVNFAAKLGTAYADVADFAELERLQIDCRNVLAVFVHWDGRHDLTAVADVLRRRCLDATIFLMAAPEALLAHADAELPGGVLLLSAPVSWHEFRIAMLNGRRLWQRAAARRGRRVRLERALAEVAQRLAAGVDPGDDPDLSPLWSLMHAAMRHDLGVDGFAVLERQRGASFWHVATADGAAAQHLQDRFLRS